MAIDATGRLASAITGDEGKEQWDLVPAQITAWNNATKLGTIQLIGHSSTVPNCPSLSALTNYQVNAYVWVMNRSGAAPLILGPCEPASATATFKPFGAGTFTGTTDGLSGLYITHGLGYTPTWAVVNVVGAGINMSAKGNPNGLSSTQITVVMHNTTTGAAWGAGASFQLYWIAGFTPI